MSDALSLSERLLAIHRVLDATAIPHAFGGAISLAYWTLNPRGTNDIDVNVFLPTANVAAVLSALPDGVATPAGTEEKIVRDGQIRLWWDQTPVDVFLSYDPVHTEAAQHRQLVLYEGEQIPILGPVELAVFKAMFDRTQDWADIEAMIGAGTLDVESVEDALRKLIGPEDERFERLRTAEKRGERAR